MTNTTPTTNLPRLMCVGNRLFDGRDSSYLGIITELSYRPALGWEALTDLGQRIDDWAIKESFAIVGYRAMLESDIPPAFSP